MACVAASLGPLGLMRATAHTLLKCKLPCSCSALKPLLQVTPDWASMKHWVPCVVQ